MREVIQTLLFIALLVASDAVSAQATYQKYFGGGGLESPRDVVILPNGDFLMVGNVTSAAAPMDSNIYLVRMSSSGDIIWEKSIGGSGDEIAWNISPVNDGTYVIAGSSRTNSSGFSDILMMKVNSNGDEIWSKTYGGTGWDDGKEAVQTSDGGFIIAGYTENVGTPTEDYRCTLIKTDAQGNQVWLKKLASTQNVFEGGGYSVKETPDGGFIYFGQTHITFTDQDQYLAKANSNGDIVWTRTINLSPGPERGQFIYVHPDGSFITVGDQETNSQGNDDINIRKYDAAGNELWSKLYGGTDKDIGKRIWPTSDGGYMVSCISRSFGWVTPDFYVMKINGAGDVIWTRNYGGTDHEHCYSALELGDGTFIAMGHTRSFTNSIDGFIVRDFIPNTSLEEISVSKVRIYPVPASSEITLDGAGNSLVEIRSVVGQMIYREKVSEGRGKIDISKFPSGIYNITVSGKDGVSNHKIMIQ